MHRQQPEIYPELEQPASPKKFGKFLLMGTGLALVIGGGIGILTGIDGVDSFSSEPKTQEDNMTGYAEFVAVASGVSLVITAQKINQQQGDQG